MFGEYFCFSSKLFYFRCGRNIFLLHWREKEWRKVKIVGRGESAGGKKFSIVEEKSTAHCSSVRVIEKLVSFARLSFPSNRREWHCVMGVSQKLSLSQVK